MIGILGGMGPIATVDLVRKIIELTPAEKDPDHVPLVIYSDPRVPSLSGAIFEGGESPVPAMVKGIRALEAGGARCIAIACNAAHHWYDELTRATSLPILHIADAVAEAVAPRGGAAPSVGILAAASTVHSGFYQRRLAARGHRCVLPAAADVERLVLPGIKLVKGGQAAAAAPLFQTAIDNLRAAGADVVALACTEIPVALAAAKSPPDRARLDCTVALAKACVAWHFGTAAASKGAASPAAAVGRAS